MSIGIWYEGIFSESKGSIMYVGDFGRIFSVDPNCLSMEYLMNLDVKFNGDRGIDGIYYLLPGCSVKEGLRKIDGDNDVVYLQAIQNKAINVYVLHKYPNSTKDIPEVKL